MQEIIAIGLVIAAFAYLVRRLGRHGNSLPAQGLDGCPGCRCGDSGGGGRADNALPLVTLAPPSPPPPSDRPGPSDLPGHPDHPDQQGPPA